MAQRYLFFNSINDDRRIYQAQDFADYFGSVLSTGLLHEDNVPGLEVSVETGTMNTVVSEGRAIMRGHYYENTTPYVLTHSIAEPTADRIDRVILRLDLRNAHRNILLHVKEGVPSANPEPPALQRDNFIYELSLAQVRIRANTSTIDPSDVTDERLDDDVCGLVYSLLGNSYLQSQINDIDSQLTQLANEFNESRILFAATGPVQTIPNATDTFLTFNEIIPSDFAILDTSNRIKIIKPGVYDIRLNVHFATNANGIRQIKVQPTASAVNSYAIDGVPTRLYCSYVMPIENELLLASSVYQTSGSNLDVISVRCTIQKVG